MLLELYRQVEFVKIKKIINALKFIYGYCKLRDCDCGVFSDVYRECCFSDGNCNLPNYCDIKNIENNLKDTKKLNMFKGGMIDD